MTKKRFLRINTIVLTIIMLLSIVMPALTVLDDTAASARVSQGHIDRLRAEKREYGRRKNEVQAKIDTIEFERMGEMAKKEILDQRIELTSREIMNTNAIIEQYHLLIREKEYEVFLAQNREEAQLENYRNRVRAMEENGMITYLEIIFDSTSFSDLLARIDFVNDIMRADETSYINLQIARNETEEAKELLEEAKVELEEEKDQLEIMEAELHEQLEEAHDLIRQLEADIEAEQELHDELIAEEARLLRQINAAVAELQRQQEAERLRRLRAQQSGSGGGSSNASGGSGGGGGAAVGSGQLSWPMSGPVISQFGPRGGRMHQGLDIGGAHGINVVAADSGTVVTAGHGRGWGNYIVISHGNGMTTLYAHLSSFAVSAGTSVSRGQVIGFNGSSGNATTPHLHFEVRVNGNLVNPMSVL